MKIGGGWTHSELSSGENLKKEVKFFLCNPNTGKEYERK